jgi:hypothetical protein
MGVGIPHSKLPGPTQRFVAMALQWFLLARVEVFFLVQLLLNENDFPRRKRWVAILLVMLLKQNLPVIWSRLFVIHAYV